MVAKTCFICKKSKEKGIILYEVPKDINRRDLWSAAIKNICGLQIKKSSQICQNHFTAQDFCGSTKKLKANAVPTKFSNSISTQIKAEPEFVLVSAEASNDETRTSVIVKDEPPEPFINEYEFDVHPAEDPIETTAVCKPAERSSSNKITKTLTCGRIVMETLSNGTQNYRLVCDHCQNSFPTTTESFWPNFIKHINEAHLPTPQKNPQNITNACVDENSVSVMNSVVRTESNELAKESDDNEIYEADEITFEDENNFDWDNESAYDNVEDSRATESEDTTYEPKLKKSKTSKPIRSARTMESRSSTGKEEKPRALILSFNHPDRACVITLLELMTTRAILWLPRQSIMKRFDQALTELVDKFNEFFPQYSMTKDSLKESIKRFKDLYRRVTDCDNRKHPVNTTAHKEKFPEFFELCAEIEENSKNILKTCEVCETIFYSAQDLQVHKYKKHAIGELPYKCQRCCYGFATAEKLASHEEKHNRIKDFKCQICGQGFFFESKLQAHIALHTDDNKKMCEVCGKKFPSLSKYRRHKLHHEAPKEKCEICGKVYFEKWTLTEHIKSHKNERQYKCDICGKAFNRQEGVTIHKRGVHKIKTHTKKYVWVNRVTSAMSKDNDQNESTMEETMKEEGENVDNTQNTNSNNTSFSSVVANEESTSDVKPTIEQNTNQQSMFPIEMLNSLLN